MVEQRQNRHRYNGPDPWSGRGSGCCGVSDKGETGGVGNQGGAEESGGQGTAEDQGRAGRSGCQGGAGDQDGDHQISIGDPQDGADEAGDYHSGSGGVWDLHDWAEAHRGQTDGTVTEGLCGRDSAAFRNGFGVQRRPPWEFQQRSAVALRDSIMVAAISGPNTQSDNSQLCRYTTYMAQVWQFSKRIHFPSIYPMYSTHNLTHICMSLPSRHYGA